MESTVSPATLSLAFEVGVLLTSLVAAVRVHRMARVVGDPRVEHLARFFGLYALAIIVHFAGALLFLHTATQALRRGVGLLDLVFWLYHGLLLAALASAAVAYGPPRRHGTPVAALAPLLLVSAPILTAVEALLLLYLAGRSVLNYVRRRNTGSLQVALGLFLLFAARVSLLFLPAPLGPHDPGVELLALVGMILLALKTLPLGRAARA